MKRLILTTALISAVLPAGFVPLASAAPVPCEDMLKTLNDALKTATAPPNSPAEMPSLHCLS